jgi:hypothetical protein
VALVAVALAASVASIVALTTFSSASEGPFGTIFGRLGAAWGSLEHSLRERVSGGGRRRELSWFQPYATNPARLRAPDFVLLGAYDSGLPATLEGVVELENALGVTFPLIHLYTSWGDKTDQQFPVGLVTSIVDVGSIPLVTWEPWLTDFENVNHPHLPLRTARDRHGLAAIARGDYDFYVDAWAADARRFGRPVFVRFGHEMNDPYRYPWGPQNNTHEEFIAAWRHVVERFRSAGADNVIWVWSPHVAYRYWESYYPGANFVDWVATGTLNFGTVAHWSQWWTFEEILGARYEALASFGKPILLAEFGSLAVGGDRTRWYIDALERLTRQFTAVRGLVFFNARNDRTVTYQVVDWSLTGDPELSGAVRAVLQAWPAAHPNRGADP